MRLQSLSGRSEPPNLAPEVGFEPTTNRLTADRSTTELLWILFPSNDGAYILPTEESAASPLCFIDFGGHRPPLQKKKLVAGAGFEPAVPQARDYERDNPVRV